MHFSTKHAVIVSDLHIGSSKFLLHNFEEFLDKLPEGYDLILNGDIVDENGNNLNALDFHILQLLIHQSFQRKVIWLSGNHDNMLQLKNVNKIIFKDKLILNSKLLVIHGDIFDTIRLKMVHIFNVTGLLQTLNIDSLDPFRLIFKLKIIRKFWCNFIKNKAVAYAIRNGFDSVCCGHTHYPEDIQKKGIRYINTGSWIGGEAYYLAVEENEMIFKNITNSS
jgi:UDP-2,3-diacylglucosamine pyrophosphatase LpxH